MIIRSNRWSEEEKAFTSEIKKIQSLKNVKPQKDWVVLSKARLMLRMETERKKDILNQDLFAMKELLATLSGAPHRAFKFAYVMAVIFGLLICGGGLTAWGAMQSLPGSPLYQVKIAMENAQLLTATSAESKIEMQGNLATRRVEELKAVAELQVSPAEKNAKLEEAVNHIQQQLLTMKDQLPKAAKTQDSQKTVQASKIVSEKTDQIEKTLAQVKESLPQEVKDDAGVTEKLAEVTETVDKTSVKALEYRVYGYQMSSDAEKEETMAKIQERIAKIEERIKNIEQQIPADKSPVKSAIAPIKNQWDAVRKLISDSKKTLEQARADLENSEIAGAWDLIKGVSVVLDGADKIITGMNQPLQPEIKAETNATSSSVTK